MALIMVPFLLLNIFMNENGNMLLMITNIFMLALYIFSSQTMVGENVLNCGILKYVLPSSEFAVRMWDVYRFHDEELLCTAMWVVLLCYVIFSHPQYHNRKGTQISQGFVWQIRSSFLFGVLAYVVPMTVCVLAMLQGRIVFLDNSLSDLEQNNIMTIDADSTVCQEIVADGEVLRDIRIRVWNGEQSIADVVYVTLKEKETNQVVYQGEKSTEGFDTNSALYSFLSEPVTVDAGKTYVLELASQAEPGQSVGVYCVSAGEEQELAVSGAEEENAGSRRLLMKVTGVK